MNPGSLSGEWHSVHRGVTIADLEEENSNLHSIIDDLQNEKKAVNENLRQVHAVLEKERVALREVLGAARKAVDDLKAERAALEAKVFEKDCEMEQLRASVAQQQLDEEQTMTEQAASLGVIQTTELRQTQRELQMMREMNQANSVDALAMKTLRIQLAEAQQVLSKQQEVNQAFSVEVAELSSLKQQLRQAATDAAELQQELLRTRSEKQTDGGSPNGMEVDKLKTALEETQQDLTELLQSNTTQELLEMEQVNTELQTALSAEEERADALQDELDALRFGGGGQTKKAIFEDENDRMDDKQRMTNKLKTLMYKKGGPTRQR